MLNAHPHLKYTATYPNPETNPNSYNVGQLSLPQSERKDNQNGLDSEKEKKC